MGMRLHLIQTAIEPGAVDANRARAGELARACGAGADSFLVLPELCSTGVPGPGFDRAAAARIAADDAAWLSALARDTGAHVLGGLMEDAGGVLYNRAALFGPDGRELLSYRKIHPFTLGGEDAWMASGAALPVAPVHGFRMMAAVCYDLRFPELFRAGACRGADLMIVPANWPQSRATHWETLLRARAIENQCIVAGVNCVGAQHGTAYAGGSRIVSPKGDILVQAGAEETVVAFDVSADRVAAWRKTFPALRDRKPDAFWDGLG